ncbi:MAG: NADPH-dependent F420 reductase [Nocardioidaceae bacterium]
MTTIGLIGAGNIGQAVARLAVDHGYDVVLSNSRGPGTLTAEVEALGAHADADSAEGAARRGDIVVVTIPLKAYEQVPVEPLLGKVVIDTNNYYPERDGQIASLDDSSTTSASLLSEHLPSSHVVKAFNHIMSGHLSEHALPAGAPDRRALAIAGDDAGAKETVTALIEEFGFDVVDVGPLSESWRIEPGTPGYGPRLDVAGMTEALAAAQR